MLKNFQFAFINTLNGLRIVRTDVCDIQFKFSLTAAIIRS